MKYRSLCASIAAVGMLALTSLAAVPPAEQLLPDDVIGLVTVPDWKKLATAYQQSAWGQLWADAAMKPFRDNFMSNVQADFLKPLEKQLGVNLSEYEELPRGQITLAVCPPKEGSKQFASVLLLMDSQDKSDLLASKLKELRKKWTDAGKEVKAEKIREVDFSSVSLGKSDIDSVLKRAFPSPDEEKNEAGEKGEKTQIHIGQSQSLLIIGTNEKEIEKVLSRQAGGVLVPLAENPAYQKSHALLFRDSLAHGWLNIKPIYEKALKLAASSPNQPSQPGAPSMKIEKILPALGFGAIETLAGKISANAEGSSFEAMLGVPEAQREGLLDVFALEKKDASPPGFVPADALKFQRTRLDAQKAWATIEKMLQKIDPSLAGIVQLMLSSAGKDRDPNFDLKKNLLGNLGDDFIQYEKPAVEKKPGELETPPSLLLIGSPNPPQLVEAIRALTALLPPPLGGTPIKEREFLGKKIYSLGMGAGEEPGAPKKPGDTDEKAPAPASKLSFATSAGYVAFSTDDGILEDYLRSGENPPKPLRSAPGLAEAAQKVGGMETGLFSYQNQKEGLRPAMEALKTDPEAFNRKLFFALSQGDEEGQGLFKHLFALKNLPSWDRISKYFGIAVLSAATTQDGFIVRGFSPMPPGLKK